MKSVFDELCSKYLGEDIMSATPNKTQAPAPQTAVAPNPTQQNNQQNPQIKDEDLFKLLQQRMLDAKFKEAFGSWLQGQQNAAK